MVLVCNFIIVDLDWRLQELLNAESKRTFKSSNLSVKFQAPVDFKVIIYSSKKYKWGMKWLNSKCLN